MIATLLTMFGGEIVTTLTVAATIVTSAVVLAAATVRPAP